MLIKKVKPHVFDIFLGKRWSFWGRFLVKRDNRLIQINGNKFTKEEFEEVEIRLCKQSH